MRSVVLLYCSPVGESQILDSVPDLRVRGGRELGDSLVASQQHDSVRLRREPCAYPAEFYLLLVDIVCHRVGAL